MEYRDLEPDDVLRAGDQWAPNHVIAPYWHEIAHSMFGKTVDEINNWRDFMWRRPIPDPITLVDRPGVWFCQRPSCKRNGKDRGRENDKGRVCLWCGADEPNGVRR